ncbi:MAG: winged helix-turn-helix transcriptional regulator, partial [Halanaerobiales bacterium]
MANNSNNKGSFNLMKKLNVSLILQTIREKGPISRSDIAEDTDLTPATVTKITRELMELELNLEDAWDEEAK